jgi:hypothetical protein
MTESDNLILLGRLATLPLSLAEWSFVLWYARNLNRLSRTPLRKVVGTTIALSCVLGVVIGQFLVYTWVAHPKRINDPFLLMVILFESLVAAGILFYVLIKRRARNSREGTVMMGTRHLRWDRVDKEVRKHRARYVILLGIFAFCAGLGTGLFLGSRSPSGIPTPLAVYATACSVIAALVFGYLLDRALRQAERHAGGPPPSIGGARA